MERTLLKTTNASRICDLTEDVLSGLYTKNGFAIFGPGGTCAIEIIAHGLNLMVYRLHPDDLRRAIELARELIIDGNKRSLRVVVDND